MAEMAWVTDTIKSIVPKPEANLSTKQTRKSILKCFPLTDRETNIGENITSFTEVIKPQL